MLISFIIPTLNRPDSLGKCVNSVLLSARQADKKIEIIIVNQAGTPLSGAFSGEPSVAVFDISKTGLSAARNHGIGAAKGDYLVFLDDDAEVKGNFVSELEKVISAYGARAYCGRLYDLEKGIYFSEFFRTAPGKRLGRTEYMHFKGSAHVLAKSIFNSVGYYDEAFGAGAEFGGAEESDMFFRLAKLGIGIVYSPDIVFYHAAHLKGEKPFVYSRSISAMLMKQVMADPARGPFYAWLIAGRLFKSLARIIQWRLFPSRMNEKYVLHQYGLVFKGALAGAIDYINYRKRADENRH